MKWSTNPFLRITTSLIFGILVNNEIKCSIAISYILFFTVLFFSLYILLSLSFKNFSIKKLQGSIGILSFVLLGYLSSQFYHQSHKPGISPVLLSTATFYTATITSKPASTAKTTKYKVEINQLRSKNGWINFNHDAILYFMNDTFKDFDYGDKLLIKGHPTYLEDQKNPYAFNYALYLQRQGIYLQDFISKNDFTLTNEHHGASLRYLSLYIGDYFESILAKYISSSREFNMIKAMLLGRRDEITPEMEYVYASSGTAHVLAVSGLHVGIVYLIFSSIFKFLKGSKINFIYYGINLCAIWSFAFITGMSPSVQRAATMLSFIIIADLSKRKSSIYNTILVSAFFILLFSPNLIFSVSFQLSYAAVFGIVYGYKQIYRLFYIKYKVLDFFWKITVISLAAQMATAPITIYYFKQFPVLFPLTNLVAIPTASVLIIGGFLLFITSPLGIVPTIIGYLLDGWTYAYNELLIYISRLSFATVENLYLKPTSVFFIICCVILMLQFLFTRKLYFFRYFSFFLVILSGFVIMDHYQKSSQREVIFYHVNNTCYFDIYQGKNCFTNVKLTNAEIEKEVSFNITPSRKYHLIKNVYDLTKLGIVRQIGSNTLIHWNDESILVLHDLNSLTKKHTDIPIDHLIIGKEMIRNLTEIQKAIKIKNLILNSTISLSYSEIVLRQLEGNNIRIHSIKKDGAYRICI